MRKSPLKRKTSLSKASGSLFKPSKPLKRGKAIKKQSDRYKAGKEDRIAHGAAMMLLFDKHWNEHVDRKCEVCNVQLYGENLTIYHDHALEKSKYEEHALDINCLILVCGVCHTMRHNGFILDRHKEIINNIKQQLCPDS